MALVRDVYRATQGFPREEMFGLTSQMRRAAVSVPSNIAEGHGRLTDKLFLQFLSQARGSLYELETQIELSADLQFMSQSDATVIRNDCGDLSRLLNGLIRTLREEATLASKVANR
jgi:four helix bundle protein